MINKAISAGVMDNVLNPEDSHKIFVSQTDINAMSWNILINKRSDGKDKSNAHS